MRLLFLVIFYMILHLKQTSPINPLHSPQSSGILASVLYSALFFPTPSKTTFLPWCLIVGCSLCKQYRYCKITWEWKKLMRCKCWYAIQNSLILEGHLRRTRKASKLYNDVLDFTFIWGWAFHFAQWITCCCIQE